jgi:hypothetical protein
LNVRVSIDRDDPGYVANARKIKVYLDGKLVRYVVTADEQRRIVIAFKTDADGCPMLNPARNEVMREELHGDVRIDLPPEMGLTR